MQSQSSSPPTDAGSTTPPTPDMPHQTRRKKTSKDRPAFIHSKQQHIEHDDGWTHVVGGNRKSGLATHFKKLSDAFTSRAGVYHVHTTVDEIKLSFERYKKNWEAHNSCGELKSILEIMQKKEHIEVTNLICLGLGSLQGSGTKQSLTQLAALLTIRDALSQGRSIQCIAQEPTFTDLDKEFLNSLDVEVADDPKAFDFINENTMVFAVHCYPVLYLRVSGGNPPASLICNDMDQLAESAVLETTVGSDGRQKILDMVKNCSESPFPDVSNVFSSTKLYWRTSSAAD